MLAKLRAISLLLIVISHHSYSADDSYDLENLSAEEAYQKGKLLRAQFKNRESLQYLRYSSQEGNSDAAYLYSIVLLNSNRSLRTIEDSRQLVLQAAHDGNRHAMKHLYESGDWLTANQKKQWRVKYYNAVITLGKEEPDTAFYELAKYFETMDPDLSKYYLGKAMQMDYAPAYMEQAEALAEGSGSYYVPGERETSVRKEYLKAAELGYIPAIRKYIQILEGQGKFESAFEWRNKALQQGDITSLASLGLIYSGLTISDYNFVIEDDILAKAYLSLYLESAGNNQFSSLYKKVEDSYFYVVSTMTEEQISKSLSLEKKLKETSFYNYDLYWEF